MIEYWESLCADKKRKIRSSFNNLLEMFRPYLHIEWFISSLERWLVSQDGQEVFRDYFDSPHSNMKDELNMPYSFSITKINFYNWKHAILSTRLQPSLKDKNIVFLDDLKEKIHPSLRNTLDNKLREIHFLEKDYFDEKKIIDERKLIKNNTSQKLLQAIS